MSATENTLAERAYAVLAADAVLNRSEIPGYEGTLSTFEMDIRDWGVVYGIAYGIALAESQGTIDGETLADRARDAAVAAYTRWGPVSQRHDERQLVEEVIRAYDSWHGGDELSPRLSGALVDLRNNIGVATAVMA